MNDVDRERSMPIFIFVSMVLHALLFLYAPHLAASLIPGFQPGEQGGVTYVTLVDVAVPERPRAAVSEAARRPQATPEPKAKPEPTPEPEQEPAPKPQPKPKQEQAPAPAPEPKPQARPEPEKAPVQEVVVETEAERPTEPKPEAVRPSQADQPKPAPAPEKAEATPAAKPVEPRPVQEESQPAAVPVMTSDRGTTEIATTPPPDETEAESSSAATQTETGELATAEAAETDAASEAGAERVSDESAEAGGAVESGSGADEDVSSAAPNAEISEEPALPPTGISMIQSFGSSAYPSKIANEPEEPLTVEVAVIVRPDGSVEEVIPVRMSGNPDIDDFSINVARYRVTYKPHDVGYEIAVFLTYDPSARSLTHKVGDFIKVPPSLGSDAR